MTTIIISVILLAIVAGGIFLLKLNDELDSFLVGISGIILIPGGITLIILHIIALSVKTYSYEQVINQRDAIQLTLDSAREYSNPLESATVTNKVIEFNQDLVSMKTANNTWLMDIYIDDRIDSVQPIK